MDQCHAVGQTVMHSTNEDTASAIPLDEVHLPRWPGHVKRGASQLADDPLQSGLIAWRWQGQRLQVIIEIQIKIVSPIGSSHGQPRRHYPLAKALKAQEAGREARLELRHVNRRAQNQHPCHDDRVGRVVHAQQQGVQV